MKKIRRLLQRKRDIKIKLCVGLSVLQLLHVGHVVRNKRSVLSFAWHKRFSVKPENEIFTAAGSLVVGTSSMKMSRRHLADCVKKLHQKACRTC